MTQSSFYLFFSKKSQISKTVNFPCATYITDWPQVSAFFFFLTNIWHYWDCNILRVIQQILFFLDITKGYMSYYNQADFFLFLFSIHLLTILFLVMMGNVLLVFPETAGHRISDVQGCLISEPTDQHFPRFFPCYFLIIASLSMYINNLHQLSTTYCKRTNILYFANGVTFFFSSVVSLRPLN